MHSCADLRSVDLAKIENMYKPGVRGCGYRSIASQLSLPLNAVKTVCRRIDERGSGQQLSRGRKHTLSEAEERRVVARVERDPFVTNVELAAGVHDRVTSRTISNVLARANPPITRKKVVSRDPGELTAEWRAEVRSFLKFPLAELPWRMRVYADEAPIYLNEAPRYGRSRRGKRIRLVRKARTKKFTLHAYMRMDRVVHWELRSENADDGEVLRMAKRVAKKWQDGDVLLWDRLGSSRRVKNPKKQHFNAEAQEAIRDANGEVEHLPFYGKYLNPCELLFQDLKTHVLRRTPRIWTRESLIVAIGNHMRRLSERKLTGYFRERADGRELMREGLLKE